MPIAIAIVGRPNVGKSTLFNRLVGRRVALVDDRPGLTRDRREGEGRLGNLVFRLIDTAGLDDASGGPFEEAMRRQTERAVVDAQLVLLLIDARAGLLPHDRALAQWLRRLGKPVIAVANKAERGTGGTAEDALALGFGEPVAISAEHGLGLAELYDALRPHLAVADGEDAAEEAERPLRLAIVGRPNVGKSTLLNRLLGEERQVTSELPGTTRDAIAVRWRFRERAVELVDTAGLRKAPKIVEAAEKLAAADARRAIGQADVVAVVIDATQPLERQDLAVADLATEEGRALIVVANKWDRVEDARRALVAIGERLERSLPQVRGVAVVPVSALTGRGIAKLMPAVVVVDAVWRRKIATGALNRWLEALLEHHPPPLASGRAVKIRYMAQTGVRPPTFALFVNRSGALSDTYLRYLANGLREHFGLMGVPIRFQVRHGKNPFAPH